MSTNAIVKFDPLASESLAPALRLSEALAKSDLVPTAYRGKPANILLATIAGQELGLGVAQSLRAMHIIEGKPTLTADAMGALCLRHADVCEYLTLIESSERAAVYETRRHGAPTPVRLSWTYEQAVAAGLAQKATWKAHRAAMLRARCLSAICRAVYPDLVLGVYDPDELAESDVQHPERPAAGTASVAPEAEPAAVPAVVEPDVKEITTSKGGAPRRILANWAALAEADPDDALAYVPSGTRAGEPLAALSDAELSSLGQIAESKQGGYWPALLAGTRRESARRAAEQANAANGTIEEFEGEGDDHE